MKKNFSYKIVFLIIIICIILAIPVFYSGYEAFNSNLVANQTPNSFGFLAATPN